MLENTSCQTIILGSCEVINDYNENIFDMSLYLSCSVYIATKNSRKVHRIII